MANGVGTENLDSAEIITDLIGNAEGGTVKITVAALATLFANSGAVFDSLTELVSRADDGEGRLDAVESELVTNKIYATSWLGDLADTVPNSIGQGAEIVDDATGSHVDPVSSVSVDDAGTYRAFGLTAGDWEWISGTGLSGKAEKSDVEDLETLTAPLKEDQNLHFPAIAAGSVELLGFDPRGRAFMRLHPDVLTALAKSGDIDGMGYQSSENGAAVMVAADGTELLGVDSRGRILGTPSPSLVRKIKLELGEFEQVTPFAEIAIWGTSLTARGGEIVEGVQDSKLKVYEGLASELGRDVFNGAVGGTDSYAISIRQGGREFSCTLSGGELPADTTAVTLTDFGGHDAFNNQTDQHRYGTLGGIPCVLRRLEEVENTVATLGWTVERRMASESATPISDGTQFIFDDAVANASRTHIFEAMRNDYYDTREQITAQRDNIVSMCTFAGEAASTARFLVIGPWPANYEPIGDNGRVKAERRRTEMKKTFGPSFVDLWDYMVNWAIYDVGMVPTADDLIDMGNGIMPRSLMDDSAHPNAAGNLAIAREYARQITARGW